MSRCVRLMPYVSESYNVGEKATDLLAPTVANPNELPFEQLASLYHQWYQQSQ